MWMWIGRRLESLTTIRSGPSSISPHRASVIYKRADAAGTGSWSSAGERLRPPRPGRPLCFLALLIVLGLTACGGAADDLSPTEAYCSYGAVSVKQLAGCID